MLECQFRNLLERKIDIKRPAYLENYLDFQFPSQIFRDTLFQDFRDLNEEIIRMGLKIGFYRGRVFLRRDFQKSNAKRLVYTCKQRGCPAKLVYLWTGDKNPITCQLFDNIHFHKKSSNLQKLKRQLIQLFIMDMPYSENWQNFKKWMYRFDIGEKDAKFIVEQLYWYNNTENQIFSKMSFEGKIVRRIKDVYGNTICVFLLTQSMKRNYLRFGEIVSFDTTYRMIKKMSPYGGQYGVGYFMAQDTNLRLVMTAICFYIKDEKLLLKQIFQFYFDLLCEGRYPFSLFTDDVKPINEAVQEVIKERSLNIKHFHGWFHTAQILRDKLENQPCGPQIFDLFCKALGETSTEIYEQLLTNIQEKLKEKQILEDFRAKQHQYSFCKMPITNHNFGILYKYGRHLNQRINQCTVFETFTGRFFSTLLHFQKILERPLEKVTVINQGLIKHVMYQEIHMLTQKIENQVMQQLFKYFKDSLEEDLFLHKLENNNPLRYVVLSGKTQKDIVAKQKYFLTYSLQRMHWECSCRIQYVNGLPCAHIIKMLREKTGGTLQYYINTRWIHDKQDRIPEFSRPLISRKLRRV